MSSSNLIGLSLVQAQTFIYDHVVMDGNTNERITDISVVIIDGEYQTRKEMLYENAVRLNVGITSKLITSLHGIASNQTPKILLGMTFDEAHLYIQLNNVYGEKRLYPITQISVSRIDKNYYSHEKDVRNRVGRMRIHVEIDNGLISKVGYIG